MAHIWKSLVQDPKKTIDEYLDLIFNDLLIQCGSRLWRSREASCLALADIIQGRKFGQVMRFSFFFFFSAFLVVCSHMEKYFSKFSSWTGKRINHVINIWRNIFSILYYFFIISRHNYVINIYHESCDLLWIWVLYKEHVFSLTQSVFDDKHYFAKSSKSSPRRLL